jgi:hypothetical protein
MARRYCEVGSRRFDLRSNRPSVLLAAAKWWPLSARLAMALRRHGCEISVVCPAAHPLTYVSDIRHIYPYEGLASLASLRRALRESQADIVIPCDDGVVLQLHALHESDPSLRTLIENSLGPPETYSVVGSRYSFLRTAAELGIRVARTERVDAEQELETWHANVAGSCVLKIDGESGGNGVRISRTLEESRAAWQDLRMAYGFATACKRLAIDRELLALWQRRWQPVHEVTVQQFIPGRPANSMLVCLRGRLLSMVSVVVVVAQGPTGAAAVVRVIQNESMQRSAELVVSRLKLTGFYGLDYILESGTGTPFLIELNPRCTQLGHLELEGKGSLAGCLSAALRGEPSPEAQKPVSSNTIALFPQALAAGEACRAYIETGYHDIPSEEPRLVRELLLPSWPQRQWAARLYHAMSPLNRPGPVSFEDLATN